MFFLRIFTPLNSLLFLLLIKYSYVSVVANVHKSVGATGYKAHRVPREWERKATGDELMGKQTRVLCQSRVPSNKAISLSLSFLLRQDKYPRQGLEFILHPKLVSNFQFPCLTGVARVRLYANTIVISPNYSPPLFQNCKL